jgi:hypothetical protein
MGNSESWNCKGRTLRQLRRGSVLLAVAPMLFVLLFDSSVLADGKPEESQIVFSEYFKMDNPREAAELLRKHAISQGKNLDAPLWVPSKYKPEAPLRQIPVWSGSIDTERPNQKFAQEMEQLVRHGAGNETVICVLQFHVEMSLNDIIVLMQKDVQIYDSLRGFAFVVSVKARQVGFLMDEPQITWIGLYEPSYKYRSDDIREGLWPLAVVSLDGDRAEFRQDLARLGITGIRYMPSLHLYGFLADSNVIDDLAHLWWVKRIEQTTRWIEEDSARGSREGSDNEGGGPVLAGGRSDKSHIVYSEYYKMDNPVEAAELLRKRAIELGRDLDAPIWVPSKYKPTKRVVGPHKVLVPSGTIDTDQPNDTFAQDMEQVVSDGTGNQTVICIVQFHEEMSLNDLIALMRENIRIYAPLPGFAFVVALKAHQVNPLMAQPQIAWVGAYKVSYKYRSDEIREGVWPLAAYSLDGDRPEFREDLTRLGIVDIHYSKWRDGYSFRADSSIVGKLAELWWVKQIKQSRGAKLYSETDTMRPERENLQ